MTLSDALRLISPVRSVDSTMTAVLNKESDAFSAGSCTSCRSLKEAQERLAAAEAAQRQSQSDLDWWTHEGEISYWRAACSLFDAAEMTGADTLPDIPYEAQPVTVMESCAAQVQWAKRVLTAARSGVLSRWR